MTGEPVRQGADGSQKDAARGRIHGRLSLRTASRPKEAPDAAFR